MGGPPARTAGAPCAAVRARLRRGYTDATRALRAWIGTGKVGGGDGSPAEARRLINQGAIPCGRAPTLCHQRLAAGLQPACFPNHPARPHLATPPIRRGVRRTPARPGTVVPARDYPRNSIAHPCPITHLALAHSCSCAHRRAARFAAGLQPAIRPQPPRPPLWITPRIQCASWPLSSRWPLAATIAAPSWDAFSPGPGVRRTPLRIIRCLSPVRPPNYARRPRAAQ
jgi:hypothetical protein